MPDSPYGLSTSYSPEYQALLSQARPFAEAYIDARQAAGDFIYSRRVWVREAQHAIASTALLTGRSVAEVGA